MIYSRLTREERYQIEVLLSSGETIRGIGRQLNREASTISREVRKGGSRPEIYCASKNDKLTQTYLHEPHPSVRKIRGRLEAHIQSKLEIKWSPQQISKKLHSDKRRLTVSCATIYRYIERDKACNGRLWKYLRILRKKRKDRKSEKWHPHRFLPDRVRIDERPKIVEKRKRLGDFERDTVLGKRGGAVLLTIVDRTSRVLKLQCIEKSTAQAIHKATVRLLNNRTVHTITNDNGFEFSHHAKTAKSLDASIYFSNAYRSWERGTNENMNGLLRQYFPKKQPIGPISKKKIKTIENEINNRPRKILGYKTPLEVQRTLNRRVLR